MSSAAARAHGAMRPCMGIPPLMRCGAYAPRNSKSTGNGGHSRHVSQGTRPRARLAIPMQERLPRDPPANTRPRTFAALAVPAFRVLWAGTWASYIPFFMAFTVNAVVAYGIAGVN